MCRIVVDRNVQLKPDQCTDTPANSKFAKGSNGNKCMRCGKAQDKHFHAKTFCNSKPYMLRMGATTCCNCWFSDASERDSFDRHACAHCKVRRAMLEQGGFAGVLHVNVHSIDDFKDTSGFMDRTDPYVQVQVGDDQQQTTWKNDAGGHHVIFNEVLSFEKTLKDSTLQVRVYDKDTMSDDFLGEGQIDIDQLRIPQGGESGTIAVSMMRKGKPAGTVMLSCSRKAAPPGSFKGILHVTVYSIDGFSDSAGFLDKTDPYGERVGRERALGLLGDCMRITVEHAYIMNCVAHHLSPTLFRFLSSSFPVLPFLLSWASAQV